MNNTITVQKTNGISVKNTVNAWLNKKNKFFSNIAEENFTNKEVLCTNIICAAIMMAAITIEYMPMISVLNGLIAAGAAIKLNNK